ncbi:autophagy protein 5 isoform X2 [Bemisia tabaci]|uniref:autophagy protein 5 isoform X2 n=1 Tax=Bemisia tabaci TaxID=7038 RepID=UPI003B28AD32
MVDRSLDQYYQYNMSMANDREVLRGIWEGKLPVCFQLGESEISGVPAPEPYYLMVPRLSYFPLVTDRVRKHFVKYIDLAKQDLELWLEFNGVPLKWHYPIGVLFDLFLPDISLPWVITARFDKFPDNEILHCPSREAVESHFMSSVKEADALKHRGQVISVMQKKDHNQLWLGLQNDKFDQFWAINKKLMEMASGESEFKHIPIRFYCGNNAFIQKLIRPINDDGKRKTLRAVIEDIFPTEYSNYFSTTSPEYL